MIQVVFIALYFIFSLPKVGTGLSATCDKAIDKVLHAHGVGAIRIDETNMFLSHRQFAAVLRKVKGYDFSGNQSTTTQHCQGLQATSWQNQRSNSATVRIEEFILTSTADTADWDGSLITIKEYWIHRQEAPKEIYLRVINESIQVLKMENRTYTPIYEVKLEAYEEVEGKYRVVKKSCH